MTLLAALVVHIGYPESCRVAFGPLEIAAGTPLAHDGPRNIGGDLNDNDFDKRELKPRKTDVFPDLSRSISRKVWWR